ncbi:MAG: ketoacyl-ACP synthase III [Bacteroidales bacterium]|nr:ketoacyl-ACP synthase III [Bacteroidales bacterium]MBD5205632.1 ketoacyl-ACP synthase III [Bacteroidales bacterium]MBD5349217.1 ketoacyl-ACP synthase III [Bacteroides sp.]
MYINATGYYIPEPRVDNKYFESTIGLSDEWIVKRTGIHTRSRVGEGENQNTMAFDAVEAALPSLPYDVKDVDLIVAAAYTAYDTVATVAHEVQKKFDIDGARAVYMSSACSSFVNGLEVIEGYFASGKAKRALLICSEHNSYYSNDNDEKAGHLWGDAAVAFFVSAEPCAPGEPEIKAIYTAGLGNISKGPEGVMLRPREGGIMMPFGRDVFVHACKYMIEALDKAGEMAGGLTCKDMDRIICHQANGRIVDNVAHQLEMPKERFVNNIGELGNTGSAGAPLAFAQFRNEFAPGEHIGITVFGGGYSCGAFIIKME